MPELPDSNVFEARALSAEARLRAIKATPWEIMIKAQRVLGTQAEAIRWLSEPAIGLDQRSPIDVMTTPGGVEQVENLLTRMEFGTYS